MKFQQTSLLLYGSSRLGSLEPDRVSYPLFFNADINQQSGLFENQSSTTVSEPIPFANNHYTGMKQYELTNHLGNVQATVSDRLRPVAEPANGLVTTYEADVSSAQEYYPFGMIMPGRSYNASEYKFGFNGQEKDDDINSTNYGW